MIDLSDKMFDPISNFLRTYSYIYTDHGKYISVFCPYCDDATRRSGTLSHGHLYISKSSNYCHCFRCDNTASTTDMLALVGFTDTELLSYIISRDSNTKFIYAKNRLYTYTGGKIETASRTTEFRSNHSDEYELFDRYVHERFYYIDPVEYGISPAIIDNKLVMQFINYNGVVSNNRIVPIGDKSKSRYIKPAQPDNYYFQDLYEIHEYDHIVISEGAVDLINLSRFSKFANLNCFYISVESKAYISLVADLITNYLLFSRHTIHVVVDNPTYDININIESISNRCKYLISKYNALINSRIYVPLLKDVSECVHIQEFK